MSVGASTNLGRPQIPPPVPQVQGANKGNQGNQPAPSQGPRAAAVANANSLAANAAPPPATFVAATVTNTAGGTTGPAPAGPGAVRAGTPIAANTPAAMAGTVQGSIAMAANAPFLAVAVAALAAVTGEKQKTGDINKDKGNVGRRDRGPDNTQSIDQPSALSEGDVGRDSATQDSASAQTSGPAT